MEADERCDPGCTSKHLTGASCGGATVGIVDDGDDVVDAYDGSEIERTEACPCFEDVGPEIFGPVWRLRGS